MIEIVKGHEQTKIDGQVVVFTLGAEKYGIEISCVKEIMKWAKPTVLPQMPDALSGVIKLRDLVIPVISLRRQFGLPDVEHQVDTKTIILEMDEVFLGINVDDVDEVVEVPGLAVESPRRITVKNDVISGIAKLDDYLLILIDTRSLFAAEVFDQITEQNINQMEAM